MISYDYSKRVRYAETDKMGYLYYGHYAKLYEIGRAELIRSLGLSYRILEDEHRIMMPVAHLECRYRNPAYYDDLLTIRTIVRDMPGRIMHFEHEILNDHNQLLNVGSVKLFFVNRDTGRNISCPEYIKGALRPYF